MNGLTFFWSNDGQTVVIIGDNGEEEHLTREEFLELGIAEEPYKNSDDNLEEMSKYYEKYFDDDFDEEEDVRLRKPTRPIRESIYDSNRWRGLKKVDNFLRVEDRKTLLESLKKDFRFADAERGYYSLLLELTYLAGDLSWAKGANENQDEEAVQEMLQSYHLEGLSIELQVNRATERMRQALDELNAWRELLGMPALSQGEKDIQAGIVMEPKKRGKRRKAMKKALSEVNSASFRPIQALGFA